jgi:integrase
MGRKRDRASTDGLLPRMEARPWKDGKAVTYRYHAFGEKKPRNLGTDKNAALQQVLDITGQRESFGTLQWVWEHYTEDPAPRWKKLTEGTQDDYRTAWKQIAKTFGRMQAGAITAPMIARYVNIERTDAPRRAVIEKALMSNLFRYGITLGVCTANPTVGVEVPESEPRTEAPEGAVLAGFLTWLDLQTPQRRIIGAAAEYASLSGSRKVEFTKLVWSQIDDEAGEIRVKRAKQRGGKRETITDVIQMTSRLRSFLVRLHEMHAKRAAAKPNAPETFVVFPTRSGSAYTARGFKTLWQRCVTAAIKAGVLTKENRFTFHDLRAYYTTVHKRELGKLPDLHANPATTARVYDRNKEVKRRAL